MKFTERLKELRGDVCYEGFLHESVPAIIEALEAAEDISRVEFWEGSYPTELRAKLDALDALVEEKP